MQGIPSPPFDPPVGKHDRSRGPVDAPMRQVEYGDYDCPYTVRARAVPVTEAGGVGFDMRAGRANFLWDVPEDVEITGPMALRLFLELQRAEDVYLFVGLQKLRAGRVVPFEARTGTASTGSPPVG